MSSLLSLAIILLLTTSIASTIPTNTHCTPQNGAVTICAYSNGQPLPNAKVIMTNQGRLMGTFFTDQNGVIQRSVIGAGGGAFYFEYEVVPPNNTGFDYNPPKFYNATLVRVPNPVFYAFFNGSQQTPLTVALSSLLFILPIVFVGMVFLVRRVKGMTKVKKGGRIR